MSDQLDSDDCGVFPVGFSDPVGDPDLPWIGHDLGVPDPVPEDRLAEEPDEVEVEDRGQRTAEELGHVPAHVDGESAAGPTAVPGIDLLDYSRNAEQKGWGKHCTCRRATVALRAARVTVDVRIAELVGLIMRANEAQGYAYRAADTGAYNCRQIAGSNRWSNHAWAIAVDENWQTNPFTSPLTTDKPRWLVDRWNRYGFAWGGDYRGRKDAMHFEFMGTPDQAGAALALARAELGGGGETYEEIPIGGVSRLWTKGEQVRQDQAACHDVGFSCPADGYCGPATVAVFTAFQLAAGISQDGMFGPRSREKVRAVPPWRSQGAREFQQALRDRGRTIAVDGVWGPRSAAALTAFQREHGLTADGRPGPQSWTALHTRPR
jgi:hypothetical protein